MDRHQEHTGVMCLFQIHGSSFILDKTIFSALKNYQQPSCRFIVKKDAPGLKVTKILNKIGLRIVQNGDILLQNVFVPDEERLPGVNSFQDTSKVLL